MKLICLDLAIHRTGYAIFDDGKLTKYGYLIPERYKGQGNERYPQKTIKLSNSMAKQVIYLIAKNESKNMEIIIEEINPNRKLGVKQSKGLSMLHGMILAQLPYWVLDITRIITTSYWRSILKIKRNGDWKASSVKYVNETLGLNLIHDEHDEADAICLGLSVLA